MKKKIIGIFVCTLMITTILPITGTVIAGDENDPEIVDDLETDIFDYLDIISAWFYENADEPDYLFTALKIKEINPLHFKQHLTVHWEHNGVECASGLHIGYGKPWFGFIAGYGHGWWFQEHYQRIEGEYDEETGIIICKIPKSIINNPQKGDVLTNTYALTFERFGFIGRMGFDRWVVATLISLLFQKHPCDFAPNTGYGRDYIIQY